MPIEYVVKLAKPYGEKGNYVPFCFVLLKRSIFNASYPKFCDVANLEM